MNNTLILGINGQDGILLSHLLRAKGEQFIGVGNQLRPSHYLPELVKYYSIDIRETEKLLDLIGSYNISQIYNLASQSSVAKSFMEPEKTLEINALSVKSLLMGIFLNEKNRDLRFFQASSSEMFGPTSSGLQSESTEFNPKSPYAEAKVDAHLFCESLQLGGHNVFCGILFNHESTYRPNNFIFRKVTDSVARIKLGLQTHLEVGDLQVSRDWGAAKDYVEAIHLILNSRTPDNYVVATGKNHSIHDLVSASLRHVGLESKFEELVKVNNQLIRSSDVKRTAGDSRKIREFLGWEPKTSFIELIHELIEFDLQLNSFLFKNS